MIFHKTASTLILDMYMNDCLAANQYSSKDILYHETTELDSCKPVLSSTKKCLPTVTILSISNITYPN